MRRSIRAVILAAVLCFATTAAPAPAEADMQRQLSSASVQVAQAPTTAAPQPEGERPPGEPEAVIGAPVKEDELSEIAIVILGTAMGAVGLAAFHYTGRWMHRRAQTDQQAATK